MAPNHEEVVESVDPSRREFLRTLIAGAGFAPPLMASFSMDAEAQPTSPTPSASATAPTAGPTAPFCFEPGASPILYLRRGPTGQLILDGAAPTAATPRFEDSPALSRSNGNPYREIGTWQMLASVPPGCDLTDVSPLTVWLGLRNSDDQGTKFDLKADLSLNGAPVASGEVLCISGVTRNPSFAKAVMIDLDMTAPPSPFSGDLDLTLSARIGTGNCSGHASAVGLRLYYDAPSRASNFDVEVKHIPG